MQYDVSQCIPLSAVPRDYEPLSSASRETTRSYPRQRVTGIAPRSLRHTAGEIATLRVNGTTCPDPAAIGAIALPTASNPVAPANQAAQYACAALALALVSAAVCIVGYLAHAQSYVIV